MIDFRHEYVMNTVASTLGLTNEEVTESLLEGNQVCVQHYSSIKFDMNDYKKYFLIILIFNDVVNGI